MTGNTYLNCVFIGPQPLGVSLWLLLTEPLVRECWSNARIQFSGLNYHFLMENLRCQEYMALLTCNAFEAS